MKNTSLCYLMHDGCYLMLHRVKKENDLNHDKWVGIGGKFEENETPEECVRREFIEETGLTLEGLSYRGIVTFVSDEWEGEYMHLFTADGFRGEMIECDEGNLEWVPIEKVDALPIWEGDRIFFRLLEEHCPFFSLKLAYRGDTLVQAILNEKELKTNKEKLLVSACLLGIPSRYDGACRKEDGIEALSERYELIPVCPEVLGGLPLVRDPSEQLNGHVYMKSGRDVTAEYNAGAAEALRIARKHGIKKALLKERSPSCGSGKIHNGLFDGGLIDGDGVTAELLKANGITVIGETQWKTLL